MEPQDKPNLSARELAARWDTSPEHLANVRSRREGMAYFKVGSRVLYRMVDVLAYEEHSLVQIACAA